MGDDSQKEVVSFYKRKIEPFVAIFILVFLIVGCILLYQDNQLKKDISKSCGWEEENYECYCQKQIIDEIKLNINNPSFAVTEELTHNVSLDR